MNATGESALHPGVCLAPDPPVPQEGIPAKICQRPSAISPLAFRSQEAVRSECAQLHGDLQSYPSSGKGQRGKRCHPQLDSTDSRKDGAGIQSEEELQRGILGGPQLNGLRI